MERRQEGGSNDMKRFRRERAGYDGGRPRSETRGCGCFGRQRGKRLQEDEGGRTTKAPRGSNGIIEATAHCMNT